MRVLIIVPTFKYKGEYPSFLSLSDFPSGLAYIASALKKAGHEVKGLNLNNLEGYTSNYEMLTRELDKAVAEFEPELIALGGLCVEYHFLRDAIEILRVIARDTPIVLGGGIVNHDGHFVFNLLKPDFAIVGEGEEAIVELVEAIGTKNYEQVDNLWYWKDGQSIFTRQNYNYPPLDDRPFPDYEAFNVKDMLDNYSMATRLLYRYSRPEPRPFTIVTARSCPFNCTFCVHQRGPKYRARSTENIMAELKETYEKYKFNILLVLDELFAVNDEKMRQFCGGVLKGKQEYGWDFDWTFQTHASAKLTPETLKLAKEAGCFMFSYGIESASPTVIKSMNKKTEVSQIVEAIKLAQETGIGFSGNLIFGDPAETDDTITESLKFWLEHCKSEFVFLSNISPYPGSKLFDYCTEKNIIKDKAQYYETIDDHLFNMTTIPTHDFNLRVQAAAMLEHTWLFAKCAKEVKYQDLPSSTVMTRRIGQKVHEIKAICPYCGKEITYHELLPKLEKETFIGTGCTHCNRRIRVNIGRSNGH